MSTSEIQNPKSKIHIWAGLAVSAVALVAYLYTLSPTVNFLDSGELITVGATAGVAHPPGYPLYTLLAILFAAVPIGETAVRVNLISALGGALAMGLFYTLVYEAVRYHLQDPVHGDSSARAGRTPRPQQRGPRPAARGPQGKAANPQTPKAQPPPPPPTPDAQPWAAISAAAGAALLLAASLT